MVEVDIRSLVGRLDPVVRRQLEAAVGLTLSRTHYNVEVEHLLLRLVETGGSDIAAMLPRLGLDAGRVAGEVTLALDKFRTGNARAPALSPDLVGWLREAWMIASLDNNAAKIRSGHLLAALLADETLARAARDSVPSMAAIAADRIRRNLDSLSEGSEEAANANAPADDVAGTGAEVPRYASRMNAARDSSFDWLFGVSQEFELLVDRLTSLAKQQFDAAVRLACFHNHHSLDIEHFLIRLLDTSESEIHTILERLGLDVERVANEVAASLNARRTGNFRKLAISPDLVVWLRAGSMIASNQYGAARIRSSHLLEALLADPMLKRLIQLSAPSLTSMGLDAARRQFDDLVEGSDESVMNS